MMMLMMMVTGPKVYVPGLGMDTLIPIRLDIEQDGYRLKDVFIWRIQDDISPEYFAEMTCRDYDLPSQTFKRAIADSMKEQIQTYQSSVCLFASFSLLCRSVCFLVRLDIIIDNVQLVDQFEWPLEDPSLDAPEQWAGVMVAELGLSGQFRPAIAHSIREQSFWVKKALTVHNHGGVHQTALNIPEELLNFVYSISTEHVKRPAKDLSLYAPRVTLLTEYELEKLEANQERETRRARRHVRLKREHMPYDILNPPRVLLTPLSYRGSLHRIVDPDMMSTSDDEGPFVRRRGAPLMADTRSEFVCSRCHLFFPSNQLIELMSGGHLCTQCRRPAGLEGEWSRSIASPFGKGSASPFDRSSSNVTPISTPFSAPALVSGNVREGLVVEPLTKEQESLIPSWMHQQLEKLLGRYSQDFFYLIIEDGEPKVKCYDCERTYMPGPNQTFNNFEIHLKNRTHRSLVNKRVKEFRLRERSEESGS